MNHFKPTGDEPLETKALTASIPVGAHRNFNALKAVFKRSNSRLLEDLIVYAVTNLPAELQTEFEQAYAKTHQGE